MRLFPRPSDSSVYQGGLFNEQELVWLNLCSRVYMSILAYVLTSLLKISPSLEIKVFLAIQNQYYLKFKQKEKALENNFH